MGNMRYMTIDAIFRYLISDISIYWRNREEREYAFNKFFDRLFFWFKSKRTPMCKKIILAIVIVSIVTPMAYIIIKMCYWIYIIFYCAFGPIP